MCSSDLDRKSLLRHRRHVDDGAGRRAQPVAAEPRAHHRRVVVGAQDAEDDEVGDDAHEDELRHHDQQQATIRLRSERLRR